MPARRKTGGVSSPMSDDNGNKDNEAYILKRQRNNDAVKKTREKSKQTAQVRKENVEKLRVVNKQMETKIEMVKANVEDLKNLLLHKVDSSKHDEVIKKILEEETDEDDD
ncbi:CCAAT/enhancer-binding protein gamma [Calliphora vicina]|uniref:CCAAT/enhancer-binding protein gamma n=1 Tax=Calliphora vicina TaxID=7373 RepID=UPI00325BEF37